MVTHSRELAEHAERIIHLLDGKILQEEEVVERRSAASELAMETP
jgi:ABC-type lipoprotein export system ATPase subunit